VLAEIWCEVLGLEKVGIDENFFEIGGHSLRAIQVISRVREIIQVELSMRDFFESPTIEALAGIIADALVREISALSEEEAQKLAESTRVPAA
jgi:acyl carrier protein